MFSAIIFDLGDTIIEEKVDDIEKLHLMDLRMQPNAASILRLLHQNYKIGILTDTENSNSEEVRAALKKLGLVDCVDAIITSTDMGVSKPHPAMFHAILGQLSIEPNQAIMVGNDPHRDIVGAKRVGLRCVFFRPTKYYDSLGDSVADYVIDDLSELPKAISFLEAQ